MDIIFKEYGRVIWQKKWYFLLALLALTGAITLDLSAPVYFKHIANGLAGPYSEATRDDLLNTLKIIAFIYGGVWLSWRLLEIAIVPLDGGGVNLLEKRCFDVLKKQKYAFFENSFSGSLIKQANRFSRSFEIIMDWFLFQFFMNILAVTISFVIFYQQQPEFAFYFLIWVVVFVSWNIAYSIWKLRFDQAVSEGDSKVGGAYSDAISNIFIVKTFAMEASEQAHINKTSDTVYKRKKLAWGLMFVSFAVQGLMTFGIELLLIYLMIGKWQAGQFQVGEFVLFQSVMIMLIQRLWEFGRNFRNFFTALADASEMADVFRQTELEVDNPDAKHLTISNGEISFNNIGFSYSPSNPQQPKLFDNFSLHIKAGEKVALVGQSGSGKSSLTKLLFRFIDPQQGSVCFDGMDARLFTFNSLRKQISMVPQQPELFHRSVRDNISLDAEITEEQLIDAARKSHSLEFIEKLPNKFDTLVGERGIKLSGGEKQRIAIARAFLEDAPIVVLDEATSALDSLTEKQIQVAIFELIRQKTAIVIAHRLSTILSMDRIVVLENGCIIEQGTHQQLLDKKGRYYEMWQHQSGDFIGS
ncbi:MAG: ABC transporter ATP-binding protein [Methylococcaceae bacterium]|nr:ABC transporter ATP-binding protein [Methylococcaceae bacterium]MDP3020791.1 ABC transporter ATP-binding protein [Methylococcaceae bacterium]MDP3390600.1 ABC transporter ATP-binding protein [Methylococcaceae bacterium]MDP3931739.1 ABC transporter ATP-binding protein [Methylococcaceae bacterium]MDZ4157971.1 ABC transporter ATP-binding protein [Methylococcales bacterium]